MIIQLTIIIIPYISTDRKTLESSKNMPKTKGCLIDPVKKIGDLKPIDHTHQLTQHTIRMAM